MILPNAFLAVPLVTGLFSCSAAELEPRSSSVDEGKASQSPTTPHKASVAPIELTQYPSAPYEDEDGMFWFSTVGGGIVRYDGNKFVVYNAENGLPSNFIRGFLEHEGDLWIATTGGVATFDGESFQVLTNYGDVAPKYTFSEGGDHRDIWDILKDRQGTIWISTMAGVFRYDGTKFHPFPLPVVGSREKSEFTPKMVYSIFEDRGGALWFATDGAGAVRYDGTDMQVFTAEDNGLCSDRICTIFQDSRGDFWFGTSDGGVSRYDGKAFTTHLRSKTFSEHTGWGRYMSIMEDRNGNVWFGASMAGGGAHRFDGKEFVYFGEKDGFGDGGIPSIREDRKGNLWFGTTAGVYRYDGERFVKF